MKPRIENVNSAIAPYSSESTWRFCMDAGPKSNERLGSQSSLGQSQSTHARTVSSEAYCKREFGQMARRWLKKVSHSRLPYENGSMEGSKTVEGRARKSRSALSSAAPMARTLVEQYRAEKMPQRYSTRQGYEVWFRSRILPR
jgi:hypothetical protein